MGDNMPYLNLGAGRTIAKFADGNRPEGYMCAILDNGAIKCWAPTTSAILAWATPPGVTVGPTRWATTSPR
jgi:hypothetical protein